MATRDPVLDELIRNGSEDVSVKKLSPDPASSSLSVDVRSEDIGECLLIVSWSVCFSSRLELSILVFVDWCVYVVG